MKWSGEGAVEWVGEREEHCLGLTVVFCRNKKNKCGGCEKVTMEQHYAWMWEGILSSGNICRCSCSLRQKL